MNVSTKPNAPQVGAKSRPPAPSPAGPWRLAGRMSRASPSAIREILKVADRPDVLSFAGGLPAPELFPVEAIAEAHARVLAREGRSALQYSTTEGHPALREWLSCRLAGRGIRAARADSLLVTSGSQQGLSLVAQALLEPGDVVVVEDPTYLAALQVFAFHDVRVVAVPSDHDGMCVDALEPLLRKHRPKLLYVVTDFQNPKGTSLSLERRRALVRLAKAHEVPILEDDPYGELRFSGGALPPLAALDDEGLVAYLGTFSKTLAPGMRLGWLHGPPALVRAATVAKQAADLHTGTLAQRAATALLETFDYDAHLDMLRRVYGERCTAMLSALERELPSSAQWTRPEGGLFLWVALPPHVPEDALFQRALEEKVAFVPGRPFFVTAPERGFLRLNFSNRPPELIEEGIRRLGAVMRGFA